MKKLKLFVSLFFVTGMLLTSCSSDDDNTPAGPVTNGNISAKWNPVKTIFKVNDAAPNEFLYTENEATCAKDYIEFAGSNVLNRVVYVINGNNQCQALSATDPATWAKNVNTLTISGDANYDGTYEITTLSNTELIVKRTDVTGSVTTVTTIYFTKATT